MKKISSPGSTEPVSDTFVFGENTDTACVFNISGSKIRANPADKIPAKIRHRNIFPMDNLSVPSAAHCNRTQTPPKVNKNEEIGIATSAAIPH